MNKKIESTVILKGEQEKIEEFKIAVAELIRETKKEPGVKVFRVFQNDLISDEFILWEVFKNQEAMDIHMESEHTKKCFSLGLFKPVSVTHHTEIVY